MPEQVRADEDVVAGASCEFFVFLPFGVVFVILDEVDDG